ncbi:small integral membrane protein 27 [Homo sapiens]|uniref:HCG1811779, isoform CRA_a n=1 Tax=Homo sapiens TaxID=9606 RepID=A0A2R8Y3B0_HUMAN|nr:hCG1811779, isoform CRA_a [Homo sapiens]KAI2552333.1 small integral membrane protein 27 [Homo sapiens]KAI4006866.1 small integral membrane protein 27 [Homo sapiens]
MKPVSRRTLDWIYSVVSPGDRGPPPCRLTGPAGGKALFLQHPETPKSIPELSISLPHLDSASSWRIRSSASYVRAAGCTRHWNPIYSTLLL